MKLPPDIVRKSVTRDGDTSNGCLSALSSTAMELLRPHLTEIEVTEGTVLWSSRGSTNDVYFPAFGLISVVLAMPDGELVEVASIAREAAIGPYFDPDQSDHVTTGVVQVGGHFFRISASSLISAANQNRQIRDLIDFCRDWMLVQAQQIAACNAIHPADKRFCRWLHESAQRMETDHIRVTQELIAAVLGIRRTTVTLIAQNLQNDGLIQYKRGKIAILDMRLLRSAACVCCNVLNRRHWPSMRLLAAPPGGSQASTQQ